jgi:hypothetical protein
MKRINHKKSRAERPTLPELDQTNWSVLNSLTSLQSRRSYRHAIDESHVLILLGTEPGIEPCRRAPVSASVGSQEARRLND